MVSAFDNAEQAATTGTAATTIATATSLQKLVGQRRPAKAAGRPAKAAGRKEEERSTRLEA